MITNSNIIIYILSAAVVALGYWAIRTENRLKKLFAGKKAKTLEDVMNAIAADLKNLRASSGTLEENINSIESRLKKSIKGVETVRFNPFKDSGGNQSFAIALLSENGDGVVLSSLYSRERMSVFAKPIKKFSSEFDLTTEEMEAVNKAKAA